MDLDVTDGEISLISKILKSQKHKISKKYIKNSVSIIKNSQNIFPIINQKAILVRLFVNYTTTKKKEVIILNESEGKLPVTIILGVLAEDWPGMSNSLLGIIHHEERNVLFIKGFTVPHKKIELGIVILAFQIHDKIIYQRFLNSKKEIILKIRNASRGTLSKEKILDDEVIKLEIFNAIVNRIKKKNLEKEEIEELTGQNGEALKFVTCRSREYLEQREILDLSRLIVHNFKFSKLVRKQGGIYLKINNFITKYEKLTGITLVCKEEVVSIEEFLETLEYIVPQYIIKHHKSFVTGDEILIYRLEIMDRYGKPLKKGVIEFFEKTLKRLIISSHSKGFTKLKSIGGFEHFARAVIPFLMAEYKKTNITQAFINSEKKTAFFVDIRLIIVSDIKTKQIYQKFINKLLNSSGFIINMLVPPKQYSQNVEINMIKLRVDFSVFYDLKEIYSVLINVIEKLYGKVRDFDKGFREFDILKLMDLNEKFPNISKLLVGEVFFSFDELYRIEKPIEVIKKAIDLCSEIINELERNPDSCETALKTGTIEKLNSIVMVISCIENKQRSILKKILKQFMDIKIYYSKIEWNQRIYLILVIDDDKGKITTEFMNQVSRMIKVLVCNK